MPGSDRRSTVPAASSTDALRRMRSKKRAGTKPEITLRKILHGRGLRYRVDRPLGLSGVRRRSDLTFVAAKVVVFVDGCFWHQCTQHATSPKNNADWWAAKLAANVARDRDTDSRLESAGWTVVRVWEHEDPESAADRVEISVKQARPEAR